MKIAEVTMLVNNLMDRQELFTVYDVFKLSKKLEYVAKNEYYNQIKGELKQVVLNEVDCMEYTASVNYDIGPIHPLVFHPFGVNIAEEYNSTYFDSVDVKTYEVDEEVEDDEEKETWELYVSESNGRLRLFIPKAVLDYVADDTDCHVAIYKDGTTLYVVNEDSEMDDLDDMGEFVCTYKIEKDGSIRISETILNSSLHEDTKKDGFRLNDDDFFIVFYNDATNVLEISYYL